MQKSYIVKEIKRGLVGGVICGVFTSVLFGLSAAIVFYLAEYYGNYNNLIDLMYLLFAFTVVSLIVCTPLGIFVSVIVNFILRKRNLVHKAPTIGFFLGTLIGSVYPLLLLLSLIMLNDGTWFEVIGTFLAGSLSGGLGGWVGGIYLSTGQMPRLPSQNSVVGK